MTGEVTFLKLVFPFQTHTLNVQARYEINRTRSMAELATLRQHSYSKLNVAWTDVFCICFENCLYLVFLPLFGRIDNLCSERIQNQSRGNGKGPQWDRTERVEVGNAPWALIAAQEFHSLWLQGRAWRSAFQYPWQSPRNSASSSQLEFSKSPLGRVSPTLKKDRRSCWGKRRHSRWRDL